MGESFSKNDFSHEFYWTKRKCLGTFHIWTFPPCILSSVSQSFGSHPILMTEKAMAPHSRILAWRIPGTEEPSELPSMGLHRVGHDWSDLAAAAAAAILMKISISSNLANQYSPFTLDFENNGLPPVQLVFRVAWWGLREPFSSIQISILNASLETAALRKLWFWKFGLHTAHDFLCKTTRTIKTEKRTQPQNLHCTG